MIFVTDWILAIKLLISAQSLAQLPYITSLHFQICFLHAFQLQNAPLLSVLAFASLFEIFLFIRKLTLFVQQASRIDSCSGQTSVLSIYIFLSILCMNSSKYFIFSRLLLVFFVVPEKSYTCSQYSFWSCYCPISYLQFGFPNGHSLPLVLENYLSCIYRRVCIFLVSIVSHTSSSICGILFPDPFRPSIFQHAPEINHKSL